MEYSTYLKKNKKKYFELITERATSATYYNLRCRCLFLLPLAADGAENCGQ